VGEEQPGSPSPSQRESLSPSMKVIGVLFNIPNIVCHIRIYTGLVAFYYFLSWPIMTIISYSISLNLDNVDGPCARYFNQSSKFGAVYDMIIDRMSTILFMMHLSVLFP
jgi:CDP-diacylglycerol--inositol 3-phosphatidyltransferase